MKILLLLLIFTYTFSSPIEKISEKSFYLMSEIKNKEEAEILDTFSTLNISIEEKAVSLILIEDENNLSLFTVPSSEYISLLQNNKLNNVSYLSHISISYLEDEQFHLEIKSGLLDYLLNDGLIFEFYGSYEKTIEILDEIQNKLI